MALEAVVYPQDPFAYSGYNLLTGGNWSYDHLGPEREDEQAGGTFDFLENQTENCLYGDYGHSSTSSMLPHLNELHSYNPSLEATNATALTADKSQQLVDTSTTTMPSRPKRRRAKSRKNKEEIENQRMTHIAVERNRRKQMNEYLSVLRSLMPDSYVQRGDQASIIGGAINFVKELEQRLQLLGAHNEMEENSDACVSLPFSEFFTFPQYSTSSNYCDNSVAMTEQVGETRLAIADIEVTMVESHANLKIRSKRRPKQLLKVVSGLHTLRLTVLHLNVTTVDEIVLYSLSVKVEDDCKLSSVDEIATAVHQMLDRIQEEAMLN
ncbi:hypothetical protein I3843_07G014200 [Carya illinoinensis]|nr:hypothetical protein I3843_07G014200 [Carya illinoinensis]